MYYILYNIYLPLGYAPNLLYYNLLTFSNRSRQQFFNNCIQIQDRYIQ